MALQLQGVPFKLTAEDMGAPDYAGSLLKGLQVANKGVNSYYQPKLQQAEIENKKAGALKNKMIGALLQKAISGEGLGGAGGLGGNNLGAAVLKGMLGIDPFLQSPQEKQQMQLTGAVNQAAQKKNIDTGSSDIARESLQNTVSMPKEYMGAFGSINMLKDRASAENGDENARNRLIQAAVAERLVPEYSGFQLMSQGQRATVPALQHQQEAIRQGWPMISKHIVGNLSAEDQKEVERQHNEAVRKVNRMREDFLRSGGKNRNQSSLEKEPAINEYSDKIKVSLNGKIYSIPSEKLDAFMQQKGAKVIK